MIRIPLLLQSNMRYQKGIATQEKSNVLFHCSGRIKSHSKTSWLLLTSFANNRFFRGSFCFREIEAQRKRGKQNDTRTRKRNYASL